MTANLNRHDRLWTDRRTADNKGFAIAGVPCFADTFVQGESSVLRMKFSAKTPAIANPRNVMGKLKKTTRSERTKGLTTQCDKKRVLLNFKSGAQNPL